jgi:hypothetical protein
MQPFFRAVQLFVQCSADAGVARGNKVKAAHATANLKVNFIKTSRSRMLAKVATQRVPHKAQPDRSHRQNVVLPPRHLDVLVAQHVMITSSIVPRSAATN